MVSWEGSRKWRASSAGGFTVSFSFGVMSLFMIEYDGGSSLSGDEARVGRAGRGEGGEEYAGGSRRP